MAEENALIKAVISPDLKTRFRQAVERQDRVVSQVLRDLIREYIWRSSKKRLSYGAVYSASSGDIIRAAIAPELKAQFEAVARQNNVIPSRVLRDLIREYVERHAKGDIWEPGREIKRKQTLKTGGGNVR
ncbi:hypothetical protein AAH348_004585 [Escherichia coli]|nr:hypothetical protein [Escherichia coli]